LWRQQNNDFKHFPISAVQAADWSLSDEFTKHTSCKGRRVLYIIKSEPLPGPFGDPGDTPGLDFRIPIHRAFVKGHSQRGGSGSYFLFGDAIIWQLFAIIAFGALLFLFFGRNTMEIMAIKKSSKDYRSPFQHTGDTSCDTDKLRQAGLPVITNLAQAAEFFEVPVKQLAWLSNSDLCHYTSFIKEKSNGTQRLIDAPRPKLKALQRTLDQKILRLRPLYDQCIGFRKGKSTRDQAAPHCGKQTVLCMDLQGFFPTITSRRVCGLFKSWGYSEEISLLFTCLTTYSGHLPQGAPTSPALANIIFSHGDVRLAGLARRFNADYTRYADDLAFSGGLDFQRCIGAFSKAVQEIVNSEGFAVNHNKTRMMRQGRRQKVVGLVVNQKPGVPRLERRRLRALVNNAMKKGLASQNRTKHPNFAQHVRGKIAYLAQFHPKEAQAMLNDLTDLV
jgi:RNA-directed DNA polymerase